VWCVGIVILFVPLSVAAFRRAATKA
jgi:hypothetical protein